MNRKLRIAFICSVLLALGMLFIPFKKAIYPSESMAKADTDDGDFDKKSEPASFVEARQKYEFDMLKNPVTGKLPDHIFERELAYARTLPERSVISRQSRDLNEFNLNNYIPAGPNNIGGRTRAVAYDLRYNGTTNKVIIAGCVSGGIMRSADGGTTWSLVTPSNEIHNFTAIAQDPRPGFQDIWYAGGGEALGNSASANGAFYLGQGIYKSTNNGISWTKLTLTVTDQNGNTLGGGSLEAFDNVFDLTHRIAVNPVNGHVYIAGHRRLVRSVDGGANFQVVFASNVPATSSNGQMDVTISNTGRVYLAVNGGNPDPALRGVWYSNLGDLNTYTRIAGGQTIGVDSVDGWRGNIATGSKRILISLAPSNQNIAYVYYENGLSSDTGSPEADLFRLDISGTTFTWQNRSQNMPDLPSGNKSGSDPLTVQGGYDMLVTVKPDDPNMVFISGTNLYRSSDGFATNTNTAWINGYSQNPLSYGPYPNGHADVHILVFNPSNPAEAICGDDGGIQMTTNVASGSGTSYPVHPVAWTKLPNYQTLQYYYVALDPSPNFNDFIGGAQDNGVNFRDKQAILPGSVLSDSNNHRQLLGGDGGSVGISLSSVSNQVQYLYGSLQYGHTYRMSTATPFTQPEIEPTGLTPAPGAGTGNYGEFITVFRLDPDNTEDMYYVNFNRLFRTTNASTVAGGGWTELTGVSAAVNPTNPTAGTDSAIRSLAFTRGPYTTSHSLYMGTTGGRIFRLDDPRNASPAAIPVNITPPGASGTVQYIAVNPNDDNEIMATVTNYGVVSIWWTNNAKSALPTWRNAEGTLALPSARSCAIVVKKDASNNPVTEYYVGTSVGLYSVVGLGTTLLASGSPVWQREGGNTLNFAVVNSIEYRPSDNVMVLGTHGNGMFYTFLGTPNYTPNANTAIVPVTNDRNFIRTIFPTVTGSTVNFQTGNMNGIKKIIVQMVDMKGSIVYRNEMLYQSGSVNMQGLAAGTYILYISSSDERYRSIQKVIKK